MNITLKNIDLTDQQHYEHVSEALVELKKYASLAPLALLGVTEVSIDFSAAGAVTMEGPYPSPIVSDAPEVNHLAVFHGNTRRFLEVMLARIDKCGSTTLEDAAADANISLDTARAYLRNAGRTASAHKVTLPVRPEWQPDMGCNTYTAAV